MINVNILQQGKMKHFKRSSLNLKKSKHEGVSYLYNQCVNVTLYYFNRNKTSKHEGVSNACDHWEYSTTSQYDLKKHKMKYYSRT